MTEKQNLPQVFENEEFGSLTVIEIDGEPWFVAKSVADILGYSQTNAMVKRLDNDEKADHPIWRMSLNQHKIQTVINESGLYNAILGSFRPEAKKFKKWVTSEVLPTIRKTGSYSMGTNPFENYTKIDWIRETLHLAERNQELEIKIETDKPKVTFAESIESTQTDILIRDLAKILKQNGIDIGGNRLFSWMRENGYLIKDGRSRNTPTQAAMNKELFRVREYTFGNANSAHSKFVPLVTGKGQIYFVDKFLAMEVK